MNRVMKKIKRLFSCVSGMRENNETHIRPERRLVSEHSFLNLILSYRRRRNRKQIIGIIKVLNIEKMLEIDDNVELDLILNQFDSIIEIKEIGISTKIDVNCSICLEKIDYLNNIQYIEPCCEQVYHLHCIGKWVKENNSCPICKSLLLEIV